MSVGGLNGVSPLVLNGARRLTAWAAIAVVYGLLFAALFEAAALFQVRPGISIWFPAVGLRLAFLLLFGWRFAFTAFVVELAFGFVGGLQGSLWLHDAQPTVGRVAGLLVSAAVSPAVYAVVAAIIRRAGWLDPRAAPVSRIFWICAVTSGGSAAAALLSCANLVLNGFLSWPAFVPAVVEWWSGDLVGALTLSPVALMVGHRLLKGRWPPSVLSDLEASPLLAARRRQWPRWLHATLEAWLVFGFAAVVFAAGGHYHNPLRWYPLFLPILWLALRFGLTGAGVGNVLANITVALVVAASAALEVLADAQVFMISLSVTGLLLGSLVSGLRAERASLERRVQERTRDLRDEILRRRAAEAEAVRESQRAQTVLALARTPIVALDAKGRVALCNREACSLLGYGQAEIAGKPWLEIAVPEDERPKVRHILGRLAEGREQVGPFDSAVRTRDGHERLIDWRATVLRDEHATVSGVLLAGLDVTERAAGERRIRYLAAHDRLTGLLNRSSLLDRFADAVMRARRHRTRLAVLFVDLDGFKAINDRLGHEAGDLLLMEAADRLRRAVRATDTVTRFGGDEFVVLVEDVGDVAIGEQVAAKIRDAVALPALLDHRPVRLGASIGISLFPDHGESPEALLQAADAAMYAAKRQGGGVMLAGSDPFKDERKAE